MKNFLKKDLDNADEYFKKAYFAAKDVNYFEGIKEIELNVKDLSKKNKMLEFLGNFFISNH